MLPLSVYLHLPFCRHLCSYCDLNAYAGLDHLLPPYVDALIAEISGDAATPCAAHSLYFGGGTPSLTPLNSLAQIFSALRTSFVLTPDCEISFEFNPEDATPDYLAGLLRLGINRLSFGVQSANPTELTLFNRAHTFAHVQQAIHNARAVGFNNLSVDLIFGIPHQTLASWQDTLRRTLDLNLEHFSIYSLSLDFGTPMRAWVMRGLLPAPNDDLAADMYLWADEELARHGFAQYEISSWAKKPSAECRHNLQYWHNEPYIGLGAGAHGFVNGHRVANVNSPSAYIKRLQEGKFAEGFSPALNEKLLIDRITEMNETMLTGLRLTHEGVTHQRFRERFGEELTEVYKKDLAELQNKKLIIDDGNRVRLTAEGRLVANWVFERFV